MKQYIMYECEKCGLRSKYSQEIKECEAGHLNLSLDEYLEYEKLKDRAAYCGRVTSVCKNEQTDMQFDNAINELIAFEKEHEIVK
jgi:hypothetical protein